MKKEKNNLFLTLLKIKSYLVSMIDEPGEHYGNLKMTGQYLDLKFPERKTEIINLLEDNNIYSDSEIAFDEKIILKFRSIAHNAKPKSDLIDILSKLDIEAKGIVLNETARISFATERERKLSEILLILFQLAANWEVLKDLEDRADNFSALNAEDVIRPDEEKSLDVLDDTTLNAVNTISLFTKRYLGLLTDYYFSYGGDNSLKEFVDDLERIKKSVTKKYLNLLNKIDLDSEWPTNLPT
jgi:hypothetical protein